MIDKELEREAREFVAAGGKRFIRATAVEKLTGFGKTRRLGLVQLNKFPQPFKIFGGRTNYWLLSEVLDWMDEQVEANRIIPRGRNGGSAVIGSLDEWPPCVSGQRTPQPTTTGKSRGRRLAELQPVEPQHMNVVIHRI